MASCVESCVYTRRENVQKEEGSMDLKRRKRVDMRNEICFVLCWGLNVCVCMCEWDLCVVREMNAVKLVKLELMWFLN